MTRNTAIGDAWFAIADHIKETYISRFGATNWYYLLEQHNSGVEGYKAAVTVLSEADNI